MSDLKVRAVNDGSYLAIIPGGCEYTSILDGKREACECASCYGHGVCEYEGTAHLLLIQAEKGGVEP